MKKIDKEILKNLEMNMADLGSGSKMIERLISNNLKRITKVLFDVRVIHNPTTKFFGMRIFPPESVVIEIASRIANNRDYSISQIQDIISSGYKDTWVIEIDDLLFRNERLVTTARERVAILLHELGHFMDKNSYISTMVQAYVIKKAIINQRMKNMIRAGKLDFLNNIFSLYVLNALCNSKYRENIHASELSADKFVVENGYGEDLYSVLQKVMKFYRKEDFIEPYKFDKVKDNEDMIDWIINSINSLSIRQAVLFTQLLAQGKITNSKYIKSFIFTKIMPWLHDLEDEGETSQFSPEHIDILQMNENLQKLYDNNQEKVQWQVEYLADVLKRRQSSELFVENFFGGQVKNIRDEDIDHIEIEIDDIRNKQDKAFVLDLIYDQMDKITLAEDLIQRGKQDKVRMTPQRIEDCKKRLEELKNRVLSKKTGDMPLISFNYPNGYEG